MQKDDNRFLKQVTDAEARVEAIRRWRLSRTLSFIAFILLFFCAALGATQGDSGRCGLFAGLGALQFAIVISIDTKIKMALLVEKLEGE